MPAILVTGGLGFIGAGYVNLLHETRPAGWDIVVLDAHCYAADERRLRERVRRDPSVRLLRCNLRSWSRILQVMRAHDVRQVVHFAASSHVSASFSTPLEFTEDNVLGTQSLLECCRLHEPRIERFVCVSTDEVYGDASCEPDAAPFDEDAPMNPTNPYSASKAAAEILARTYGLCYGLPVLVTRGNNVIGPQQHPEKLVPAVIQRLAAGQCARVEGDGLQRRSFLYLDDVARAIEAVRCCGAAGAAYNIGGSEEHTVLQVVEAALARLRPGERLADWVEHVADRPYQDRRYFVDTGRLHALGWRPRVGLAEAVGRIVDEDAPALLPAAAAAARRSAAETE